MSGSGGWYYSEVKKSIHIEIIEVTTEPTSEKDWLKTQSEIVRWAA